VFQKKLVMANLAAEQISPFAFAAIEIDVELHLHHTKPTGSACRVVRLLRKNPAVVIEL
jgi:hypothetical protein